MKKYFKIITICAVVALLGICAYFSWISAIGLALILAATLMPAWRRCQQIDNPEVQLPRRDITRSVGIPIVVVILFILSANGFYRLNIGNFDNRLLYDSVEYNLETSPNKRYHIAAYYSRVHFLKETGSFEVFIDGKPGVRYLKEADLMKSQDPQAFQISAGFLKTQKEATQITIKSVRPIFEFLSSPELFYLLLSIIPFLFLLQQSFPTRYIIRRPQAILLGGCVAMALFYWLTPEPLRITSYTADSVGFLMRAGRENIVQESLVSMRTASFSQLAWLYFCLFPVDYDYFFYFQSFIFIFALGWTVFELYKRNLPLIVCLVIFGFFINYGDKWHAIVSADSSSMSGFMLLFGASLCLFRMIENKKGWLKIIIMLIINGLICYYQLMIKSFPGTIFIQGGMLFFMFLIYRKAFFPGIRWGILMTLLTLLPALGFCTYRYHKVGEFNFASIVNVSKFKMVMLLTPLEAWEDERISEETRAVIKDFLETNKAVPIPLKPNFKNRDFDIQYNRLRGMPPKGSAKPVEIEKATGKMLEEMYQFLPKERKIYMLKTYFFELNKFISTPKDSGTRFITYSPFIKNRFFWWLLLPLAGMIYLAKYSSNLGIPDKVRFDHRLLLLLGAIAFLGVVGTTSTILVLIPVFEERRTLGAFFPMFFAVWGTIFYLCFSYVIFVFYLLRRLTGLVAGKLASRRQAS